MSEINTVSRENVVETKAEVKKQQNVGANVKQSKVLPKTPQNTAQKIAPVAKSKVKDDVVEAAKRYPEHYINIALLIKNNAEIRRFTSIGIINYLLQKGEIRGEKRYVVYKWNKFSVRCDSLIREYYYTEPFFLNCLVASFSSFSAAAQKIINTFTRKEMSIGFNKAIDAEEVNSIISDTEAHINEQTDEPNDCITDTEK